MKLSGEKIGGLDDICKKIHQLNVLVQDLTDILAAEAEDAPLAFFETCEDIQYQVTQIMRDAFLAVQNNH